MPRKPPKFRPGSDPHQPPPQLGRLSAARRGYDRRWRRARRLHLAEHPLCVECQRAGRVTAAEHVDHVVPHRGDATRFWDPGNWQSLCAACHRRKTAAGL